MEQLPNLVEREEALSLAEVREWFEAEGIVVSNWAAENGFAAAHVYAVLAGRSRGRRGHAHQIAVALGLKNRRRLSAVESAPAFVQACA